MSTMDRVMLGKENGLRAGENDRNPVIGYKTLGLTAGETSLESICCLRKLTL